jgi:hypothetical protein
MVLLEFHTDLKARRKAQDLPEIGAKTELSCQPKIP